ncbi:hypothetical protein GCM10010272_67040 [Streptomyces lateritius]|nr:hypothetical protein GCM10010272_67040 [Streptomyces lateritius]
MARLDELGLGDERRSRSRRRFLTPARAAKHMTHQPGRVWTVRVRLKITARRMYDAIAR